MLRWVLPLAAIGFAHAAGAGELDLEHPRGSKGHHKPTYKVTQSSAREWFLRGSKGYEPSYEVIQSPAQGWNAAPYRPVIATPAAPVIITPTAAYNWTGF